MDEETIEFLKHYDQGAIHILESVIEIFELKGEDYTISGPQLIKVLEVVKQEIIDEQGEL
jgi:hypothetical protein